MTDKNKAIPFALRIDPLLHFLLSTYFVGNRKNRISQTWRCGPPSTYIVAWALGALVNNKDTMDIRLIMIILLQNIKLISTYVSPFKEIGWLQSLSCIKAGRGGSLRKSQLWRSLVKTDWEVLETKRDLEIKVLEVWISKESRSRARSLVSMSRSPM